MADSMDSFVERVESGTAKIREEADPIRIKTADQPFDYGNIPSAGAFAFLVAVTLIFFVAWISPIAAAVAAGLLVANSVLELPAALMASIFGILTVELLFFFCGRWDVASLLQRWPFRSMVCERLVEVSEKWIQQSGALFLFKTPLYHGSRLSVLFAAGKLRCSFWRFFIVLILSTFSLGSAALLLALLAGTVVLAHFSDRHASNVELLAGVWFLLYIALNILPPQFSFRGRRLLLSEWRRKRRWEFWPIWAIYPPVVLYILFLGLRNRCLTLFTAVNPTMPASGFMGTGKIGILTGLAGAEDSVAQWISVEYDSDREEQMAKVEGFLDDNDLQYPVVFKPVDGQRGLGVTIVQSPDEARRFFDRAVVDTIVQEQISGEEYGIFYYRYPDEEKGRIFSITDKRLLSLRGDGEKTLEELILEDDRAVCMAPFFLFQHRERLFEIPGRGEHIQITELGVHSRGSLFLDGGHLLTPALTDAVDAISKQYEGFFFGRYDMRVPSAEALQEGRDLKVIELNGITSEATHIYDPGNSYFYGCRTLMEQWRIAFEIGARNSACGVEPLSLIALLHHCLEVNARQRRIV